MPADSILYRQQATDQGHHGSRLDRRMWRICLSDKFCCIACAAAALICGDRPRVAASKCTNLYGGEQQLTFYRRAICVVQQQAQLCCPSSLQLLVCCNNASDENIWHNARMRQDFACHWGDTAVLKPGMHSSLLIGVPICCNHRLHHQHLQAPPQFITKDAQVSQEVVQTGWVCCKRQELCPRGIEATIDDVHDPCMILLRKRVARCLWWVLGGICMLACTVKVYFGTDVLVPVTTRPLSGCSSWVSAEQLTCSCPAGQC